jgi:hypothetical protein
VLGWCCGDFLIVLPAGFLAFAVRAWLQDDGPGKDFLIFGGLCVSVLAWFLAALGVAVWGWVEALYVPEGLLYFARNGMVGWARRALANGVPVDVTNELGETPLLLAAANGHGEIVKLLLLSRANPALPDRLGQTPLDAARTKGHADIADILRRNSRATDSTSPDESSPGRSHPRRRLLADVVLAAFLGVLLGFLFAGREITPDELAQLIDAKQLKEIMFAQGCVRGEVKDPDHPVVRPLRLAGGKFWVRYSPQFPPQEAGRRVRESGVNVTGLTADGLPQDRRPSVWMVVVMIAWPVGVLGLGLLPLLGSRGLFPFLALSGRRDTVALQA